MRNYNILNITYSDDRIEEVLAVLPDKIEGRGGGFFGKTHTFSYWFNPLLTSDEVKGLCAKFIDLDVNSFEFRDERAMGE